MNDDQYQISNGVLEGKDGHLFLADGNHKAFDFARGIAEIDTVSVSAFRRNIRERSRICANFGVKYWHVIFPDKQSVLSEHLPFDIKVRLGEAYMARCPELNDKLIYPIDLLRRIPDGGFQKTDTHLNDIGSFMVARDIIKNISHSAADTSLPISEINNQTLVPWTGDLGGRFTPPRSEMRPCLEMRSRKLCISNNLQGANNGLVDIILNRDAPIKERFLIFGDSFGRLLARFLSHCFSETIFLRSQFFHEEVFTALRPNYAISENVERYLSNCLLDEKRPNFFMLPFLGAGKYEPSKDFATIFSALLMGNGTSYQKVFFDHLRCK